jgi:uncharacterized protein (TIGR02145 family)
MFFSKGYFMSIYLVLFSILFSSPFLFSQKDVKIGTQVWMARNLDVDTFSNGELIPQATCREHWDFAADNNIPAWCYYEFNEENGEKYGKLYNWFAVNDPRHLSPEGYHVPWSDEWEILVEFLGGKKIAGKMMKSVIGWDRNGNGDNSSGFSGLPGGVCNDNGDFRYIGLLGNWWISNNSSTQNAWVWFLAYDDTRTVSNDINKGCGLSVRCIKD